MYFQQLPRSTRKDVVVVVSSSDEDDDEDDVVVVESSGGEEGESENGPEQLARASEGHVRRNRLTSEPDGPLVCSKITQHRLFSPIAHAKSLTFDMFFSSYMGHVSNSNLLFWCYREVRIKDKPALYR